MSEKRKTVVITGSSRGLGFEMAKRFRTNNYNVVINGVNETRLNDAAAKLTQLKGAGKVCACAGSVEGHGSNDAHIMGLNMYGTGKRAVTYFTEGLAQEAEELKTGVIVGKLSPGIMISTVLPASLMRISFSRSTAS